MFWVREIKYILFLIRLWNHCPSKNEAREVDVSQLCVYMGLSGFNCILFTFYELALSDESLLLCDIQWSTTLHIQSFWAILLVVH